MTISSIESTKKFYVLDGAKRSFFYDVPFSHKDDIVLTLVTLSTSEEIILDHPLHYSIFAENDDYGSGATVTTVTAYPSTQKLVIHRDTIRQQIVDLTESAKIPSRAIEDGLDNLERQIQDIWTFLERVIKVAVGDSLASTDFSGAAVRAGKQLTFDENGLPQFTIPDPNQLDGQNSIERLGNFFKLVGDLASVPASYYYGTNVLQELSFFSLPVANIKNVTYVSEQGTLAAAQADSAANNYRPILVDADISIDAASVFDTTGTVIDASGTPVNMFNATVQPPAIENSKQFLDNAAAVDIGGGLVDIPVTGHGYVPGHTIRFFNTINYDNKTYTVQAGTTTDLVRISETYTAESFAGTEEVTFYDANMLYEGVFPIDHFINPTGVIETEPGGAGSDIKKITVTDNPFAENRLIAVSGSTGGVRDKIYRVLPGSTSTGILIKESGSAYTWTGSEKIVPQRRYEIKNPTAGVAVKTRGTDRVGIRLDNHDLRIGQWVSLRLFSDAALNGEFMVQPGTTRTEFYVKATLTAGVFNQTGNEQFCEASSYAIDRRFRRELGINKALTSLDAGVATGVDCPSYSLKEDDPITIEGSGVAGLDGNYLVLPWRGNAGVLPINKAFGAGGTVTGGYVFKQAFFGLPVISNDFVEDTQFEVTGTTNYNQDYISSFLTESTNGGWSEVVAPGNWAQEQFTSSAKVYRKFARFDLAAHGLNVGDWIEIENDSNYNGIYEVFIKTTNSFYIRARGVGPTNGSCTVKLLLRQISTIDDHNVNLYEEFFIRDVAGFEGRFKAKTGTSGKNLVFNSPTAVGASASAGKVGKTSVTISGNHSFVFLDNNSRFVFGAYITASFASGIKLHATDEQAIFKMEKDDMALADRTKVIYKDIGMQSHVLHWGAINVDNVAHDQVTGNACKHAWNTASDSGCRLIFGRGTYRQGFTLAEGVNVDKLTTNAITGVSSRQTLWRLGAWVNDGIFRSKSNNWHNALVEKMDFQGNRFVNRNTPYNIGCITMEGYNFSFRDIHVSEYPQIGLRFNGGQSNGVNLFNAEIEDGDFDNCVFVGVNVLTFFGCSIEQARTLEGSGIGCRIMGLSGSYFSSHDQKCTVINNYMEGDDAADFVFEGVSYIKILSSSKGTAGSDTVHVRRHPYLGSPCNDIEIDAGQYPGSQVRIDPGCGNGVNVVYPHGTQGGVTTVIDKSRNVKPGKKGLNPWSVEIKKGKYGTTFFNNSHPCFGAGASVLEPFGDGSVIWKNGIILPEKFCYIDINTSTAINDYTRWQTSSNKDVVFSGIALAAGTYYLRLLCNIPPNYQMQVQATDTGNSLYYNWEEQCWDSDILKENHRLRMGGWGIPELLATWPVVTTVTRTISFKLALNSSDNKIAIIQYWDVTDSIDSTLVHKRDGQVIGYGFDDQWAVVEYTGGPQTLNYWQRTVFYDATGGAFQVNLPPTFNDGGEIHFVEIGGSANNLTVGRNGNEIEGLGTSNDVLSTAYLKTAYTFNAANGKWVK